MTAFTEQINTILDGLGDDATPDVIANATRDYSARDVLAVVYARTDAAGGGAEFPDEWTVGEDGDLNITGADVTLQQAGSELHLAADSAYLLIGGIVDVEGEASIVAGAKAAQTKPVMVLYDADFNNIIFQVDADGTIHILTGTTIQADL